MPSPLQHPSVGSATGTVDHHRPDRVIKTLRPLDPGTLKMVERYGDALVCVRYRQDAHGIRRFTTVELIVDSGLVKTRGRERDLVEVRIEWRETTLRARAKVLGGRLDPDTGLWQMTRRAARILGLLERLPG